MKIEITCAACPKKFLVKKSRLERSKSGHLFCSKECKNKSQRLTAGFSEMQPSHYGTSDGAYKARSKVDFSNGCIDCGEKREWLLTVHHIDGDRKHNEDINYEVVCFNCHAKRHLKLIGDKWVYSSYVLTPREMLDKL